MCSDERQRQPFRMTQTCLFLHEVPSSFRTTVVCSALVLGQAHTPKRRLALLAALAMALLAAPAFSSANASHRAASLRAQDAVIAQKSRSAVLELYALDEQYATAQSKLVTLRHRALSLRAQRKSLARQLAVARRSTRISQARLAQRLRVLYEDGSVDSLEVLLGSQSLDEALTNLDNLNRAATQGEDVLGELKAARTVLRSASRALATRQSELAASVREAEATASALVGARASRRDYIGSLAAERRMNEREITKLVAEAQAAQARTAELAFRSDSFASAPAKGLGRTLTVSATGYSLPGTTSSGLPVGWGVVAVDPSLIPLGTHMAIPGYGEGVAADTGTAVIGATIDLWFPSLAQADAWGRRTVTIVFN